MTDENVQATPEPEPVTPAAGGGTTGEPGRSEPPKLSIERPEITIARGNVLRGSTTSPAIVGASSSPAKPKQRLAKKRTVGSAAKLS